MKRKIVLWLFVICMFLTGCNSEQNLTNKSRTGVDTTGVINFTDKIIVSRNYEIIERNVIQRTDNKTLFVVEYLIKQDNKEYNYGFYISQIKDNFEIIDEGENIDRKILNE